MNERAIDLIVVGAYLLTITSIGIWAGRKTSKSKEGYILGGRSLNWVLIGLSLYATNISASGFIGGSGLAFKIGIAAANPELLGGFCLSLSAMIFIPIYLRNRILTIPQFLELRFSRATKLFYGGANVIRSFLAAPVHTYVGALLILGLFGFEVNTVNILICGGIVTSTIGMYVIVGGLRSVVITDTIQVGIMLGGGILVVVFGLIEVGGIQELYHHLGQEKFKLWLPYESEQFAWDAVLFGNGTASAIYAICAISVLQRTLAAKSVEDAQKGMLLGGFLKMFALFLYSLPGLIALVLFQDISPDSAYPLLAREVLPIGLRSIVLAAMIAALMSSEDSSLNANAGIIAVDIIPAFWKNVGETKALTIGKLTVSLQMIVGVLLAPSVLYFDIGVLELILKIAAFLTLPAGICFIFGRFSKRANETGALATLIAGLFLGIYYVLCSTVPELKSFLPNSIADTQFYRIYPFFFLFLSAIMMITSWLSQHPAPEKLCCLETNLPNRQKEIDGRPFYKKYYFWMIIYICCFLGVYWIF